MNRRLVLACVLLLTAGCDGGGGGTDAGIVLRDSGPGLDAGMRDSGGPRDAGPIRDTGPRADAGGGPAGACPDMDLAMMEGVAIATGVTTGRGDDISPDCTTSETDDFTFTWTAPRAGTFIIDTSGSEFDTVLVVLEGDDCSGTLVDCDDDGFGSTLQSRVVLTATAGTTYLIAVDGYSESKGPFTLSINEGTESEEGLCADGMDNDRDEDVDCDDFDCSGEDQCSESGPVECADTLDNDTDTYPDCEDSQCWDEPNCVEDGVECGDTLDNDGDEEIDCDDFDCFGEPACVEDGVECSDTLDNDADEAADCADTDCADDAACIEDGAECSDTADNDDDGAADCLDPDCARVPACDTCPDQALSGAVGAMVAMGSNATLYNRRDPATEDCASSAGTSGRERTFSWVAPTTGMYRIDSLSSTYDTVLYVLTGSCSGAEVACDDDGSDLGLQSVVTLNATAGTTYIIVLDGYSSFSSGDYVLNIMAL